jgi:RimJ/RimL family protein N-acetyltransferase
LETERLILRPLTDQDLGDLAAMLGDPEVMRFYSAPKTRAEAEGWLRWNQRLYAARGFGLWAMEHKDTGEFVGDCGLTPQPVEDSEEIEVGYHVASRHWRKGYASEAARACRDHAFDVLGVERLVAIIHPDNVASQGVARKIGMSLWKTIVWQRSGRPERIYSMGREDRPAP